MAPLGPSPQVAAASSPDSRLCPGMVIVSRAAFKLHTWCNNSSSILQIYVPGGLLLFDLALISSQLWGRGWFNLSISPFDGSSCGQSILVGLSCMVAKLFSTDLSLPGVLLLVGWTSVSRDLKVAPDVLSSFCPLAVLQRKTPPPPLTLVPGVGTLVASAAYRLSRYRD